MPHSAKNSSLRSPAEDKLIKLSKAYNRAFANKDINKLDSLFAAKVVYYADKVTLKDNISGRSNVLNYIKFYFDSWDFQREDTFGAVDENDSIAFSVSVDKGVKPKAGVHDEQKKKDEVKPSSVINITALIFDHEDKIISIYPVRQLSYDEAHRKLKKVPDYAGSDFDPTKAGNEDIGESAERAEQHEHYAALWNKMFCDNDISKAEQICDKDVKVHNLLTSDQTNGLDEWKNNLAHIFKDWECKGNRHSIAVTPGNKAFVWWETTGVNKGEWTTVWGISVLIFNKDDKIGEVAAIYQPFPGMKEALVKGE